MYSVWASATASSTDLLDSRDQPAREIYLDVYSCPDLVFLSLRTELVQTMDFMSV